MYIKFCRGYGGDKKDEASEKLPTKLSVDLEEDKGSQTEGNARLYRAACLLLGLICLILLLVVIALGVKLRTGSTVCTQREEETTAADGSSRPFAPTCSYEQCQAHFPHVQHQRLGCMQCAAGWLAFGRSCFYLSTFRLNWYQSQQNCTARGGSLAVIDSQNVQNFLTKEGKLRYWIGLRQEGTTWTWVSNTVLRESHWAEDLQEGNCGILWSESPSEKNWMVSSCDSSTYFICQLQF